MGRKRGVASSSPLAEPVQPVAPVASHSEPFYTSIPASSEKAYLELNGASHFAPNIANTTIAKYSISWLKRYIDKDSIDVCVSSWRRVSDNAIPTRAKPTGAYLNSALARREAFDNGYDEAILLTEDGKVSEGSAEHVFIVRRGKLVSPPSTYDNLDGITRRSLLQMAVEDLKLEVEEREIGRSELYIAEELFLCGTGAQITPVRAVDKRKVGDGAIGPVTTKLQKHFDDVVHGRVPARKSWLFPVWG